MMTVNKSTAQPASDAPLKIAIVGVVHGHVHGFLRDAMQRSDIEVVGVYDADAALVKKYGDLYNVPTNLRYTNLEKLLEEGKPAALTLFTNTFDHTEIVEMAAPLGIHVMMEKPLAVSMDHANRMYKAAKAGGIHVLVNYETTWYASNAHAYQMVEAGALGTLRKIVVHDGHFGPKEIGVDKEFLDWLVDPVLNGGGALTDFGCYGANLMTWLLKGEMPESVMAVTQQLKSDPVYSKVDDETNILVTYAGAQGIIQASWNWPYHRKDMEVYGDAGMAIALNSKAMQVAPLDSPREDVVAAPLTGAEADPLSYLKAVVDESIVPAPHDLSALENNIMVTRILDAARESAATGKRVYLTK
ncbi:MAG: Gfo/Idh/MocA family oxidoreductase [Bacteroidota bacterium]